MNYWMRMIVAGALGVAAGAGCGRQETAPAAPGAPGKTGGRMTIAVVPKSNSGNFWETVREGAQDAATRLEVDMRWIGPLSETEIPEQNRIIENMINLGVKGMALAPLNRTATRKSAESVVAAGIPLVIFDSDLDSTRQVSFVATNNEEGGAKAGRRMGEILKGRQARLMVLRFVQGTGSCEARAEGFIREAKAAGFDIVADVYPEDGTITGCKKAAANSLERFIRDGKLELDGIFACNEMSTVGMLDAVADLRKSGVTGAVKMIGFDCTPRMLEAIRADEMDSIVVQNPRRMGALAVETLVKHLRGEAVEKAVDTGAELVTKERLASDAAIRALVGAE